jgi:isopentenyl-diphosphate Delta-isomerase
MTSMEIKQVTLVDSQDNVLGEEDLYSAHSHNAKLHRAVSVWIIRDKDGEREVLLQKRSLEKIVGADQWGNGICGNVFPGESYLGCANRRLEEEIGVKNLSLDELYKFEYKVFSNEKYGEYEMDQVFITKYDGEFELNPAEVSQIEWVKLSELERRLEAMDYITAKETLKYETKDLQEKTPPIVLMLNDKKSEIAPWTAIMLFSKELWSALKNF